MRQASTLLRWRGETRRLVGAVVFTEHPVLLKGSQHHSLALQQVKEQLCLRNKDTAGRRRKR